MRVLKFVITLVIALVLMVAVGVGVFAFTAPKETVARFDPRTPLGQATWGSLRSGDLSWSQIGELLGPDRGAALNLLAGEASTPATVFDPPTRELATGDADADVTLRYTFLDRTLKLGVRVTRDDLRDDVDIGDMWVTDRAVRQRRVERYVDSYARSELVGRIADGLREQRDRLRLDRDQYAELIASMVQQIPYGSPGGDVMRSPVRVLLDNKGDCDEKSILAAAVLRHEGYSVAILDFSAEDHAAVGVPSDASRVPGTKFALLESTGPAYIGEIPEVVGASGQPVTLDTEPEVIVIDGGAGNRYTAGREVAYILERRAAAEETIAQLEARARAASGRQATTVEQWKADNALITRYNAAVEVANRCVKGVGDRAGTYAWLRAHP